MLEYLIIKEFFTSTLDKFDNIEVYLNKVKEITNELKSRDILLLNQVVIL